MEKGGATSMKKLIAVKLGLENTDVFTIPIEKISILKINNEDFSGVELSSIEKPDLEIRFNWELEQSGYFNSNAENIEEEKAYWLPFFQSDNFNVVDVELIYDDNSKFEFNVPYEDTGDFTPNIYETLTHPTEQEIHILIKKET